MNTHILISLTTTELGLERRLDAVDLRLGDSQRLYSNVRIYELRSSTKQELIAGLPRDVAALLEAYLTPAIMSGLSPGGRGA